MPFDQEDSAGIDTMAMLNCSLNSQKKVIKFPQWSDSILPGARKMAIQYA